MISKGSAFGIGIVTSKRGITKKMFSVWRIKTLISS